MCKAIEKNKEYWSNLLHLFYSFLLHILYSTVNAVKMCHYSIMKYWFMWKIIQTSKIKNIINVAQCSLLYVCFFRVSVVWVTMYAFWMRIVASVIVEQHYLRHVLSVFGVWVSFGGEINCLAKMHVGNADCMKSFE